MEEEEIIIIIGEDPQRSGENPPVLLSRFYGTVTQKTLTRAQNAITAKLAELQG